jgi:transcriptional regulator with XRE-family HTH domain
LFARAVATLRVFVLNLEFKRREKRFTQARLARLGGMTQCHVSLAEAGQFVPNARQLARLARVLGIPADEVLKLTVATVDLQHVSDEAGDRR